MNENFPFHLYTFYTLHKVASELQQKHLTRTVKAYHTYLQEGHAIFILGNNLIANTYNIIQNELRLPKKNSDIPLEGLRSCCA